MKTKLLLLAAVLTCVCSRAFATDYTTLYVLPADKTQPIEELTIADITSFTFSDGKMVISMGDNSQREIALAAIDKLMVYEPTAISKPAVADEQLTEVYSIGGQRVASGKGQSVLEQLPKGVYIVRNGLRVVKVTRQ